MTSRRPPPAIRVRDLGLRFNIRSHAAPTVHAGIAGLIKHRPKAQEFWALRDVSFDVQRGTVLGVIGANGSGKSTLLRVLGRIFAPDEGEVTIRGKISSLITLGAGFQANLSGLENITYNGLLLGLTRQEIQERLESIIAFAELGDFINAPVRTYSTGMRTRLGFSVAVHVEPEILVLDEVLAVGDARFRQRCADKMRELFNQGTTVVMVQHNLEAILDMCHRCLWLDKGHVQKIGDPYEIVKAYLESSGLPMIDRVKDWSSTDASSGPDMSSGGAAAGGDLLL